MDKRPPFTIGLFEMDTSFSTLLPDLLMASGHQVLRCSTEAPSLVMFLETVMGSLKQERAAPYDVLLLVLSSGGVGSHTRAMLAQLASFGRLPVVVLSPIPLLDRHPFLISVVMTPFLTRFVFRPQDLGAALEKATGVAFPSSGAAAHLLSQWLSQHMREAIHLHQGWIDLRQKWLRQRHEWIHRRQIWLHEQQAWIEQQHPETQKEWLEEQEEWIKGQQQETHQQERRLAYQHHWLAQQQRKLDILKQALLLPSSPKGDRISQPEAFPQNAEDHLA